VESSDSTSQILTDLSGLSIDCTNLRESTEVERMVSVRPRRNILSDALSYVAQVWPYILENGEESHRSEFVLRCIMASCEAEQLGEGEDFYVSESH